MNKSVTNAIQRLLAHARAVPSVKDASNMLPEGTTVFPFAVAYPAVGQYTEYGGGGQKGLHTLYVEFHFARSLLGSAVKAAQEVLEIYPGLLIADPSLGGSVSTVLLGDENPMIYRFGRLMWGSMETIGIRYEITVKIVE